MHARMLTTVVLAGCGFAAPFSLDGSIAGDGVAPDGQVFDAPPQSATVAFTSVTATISTLRPGQYGWVVVATLQNTGTAEITDVAMTLTFATGAVDRVLQFRWRESDLREGLTTPTRTIPPGGALAMRFQVDALAFATPPGPVEINGVATFVDGGVPASAQPLAMPLSIPFATIPAPIVVTTASDERAANATVSLREAIASANANPGFDRIIFDPTIFPDISTPVVIQLDRMLAAFPDVSGGGPGNDLVIDASTANIVLALDSTWGGSRSWGFRHTSHLLVIHGLHFRNFGFAYPATNVTTDNCMGGRQEGGAVRSDGGVLILQNNSFADPGVLERNCFAAAVELRGDGAGHRIIGNDFTDVVADAVYVTAAVTEITDNLITGGDTPTKADDGIVLESNSALPVWVVGNVIVDQDFAGLAVFGGGQVIYAAHNTFARNNAVGSIWAGSIWRLGTSTVNLLNNAHVDNLPAALFPDVSAGIRVAYDALQGNVLCSPPCPLVVVASILESADLLFTASSNPRTRADFTPLPTSPLVDSAFDALDRNGPAPGRYHGAGPDRGAVERP